MISEDENLKNKLEKQLNKKLIWETKLDSNALFSHRNNSKKQTEILLDNAFFSFKAIISFLETHKNKGFTFKIIPNKTLFAATKKKYAARITSKGTAKLFQRNARK